MKHNVKSGVVINGKHSYFDYGLFMSKRPDYGTPDPKTSIVPVPGMDGSVDLTEADGFVKYSNRNIVMEFSVKADETEQAELLSGLRNDIHGQIVELIFDDQPEWSYSGRATVEVTEAESWKMNLKITVEAYPYKIALAEDAVSVLVSETESGDTHLEVRPTYKSETATNSTYHYDETDGDLSIFTAVRVFYKNRTSGDMDLSVTDANGGAIMYVESNIDFPQSGYVDMTFSGSDFNPAVVRKITTSGAKIERVEGATTVSATEIYNDRMPVVPQITLTGSNSAIVSCGGRTQTVRPGTALYENLVLLAGKNTVAAYRADGSSGSQTLTLRFHRGRL